MKLFVAAVVLLIALEARVLAETPEIDALRVRAEQGDPEAQYDLQGMYRDGPGVPQMVRWYRLAGDQGYAAAQYKLGFMYANGTGIPQDEGRRCWQPTRAWPAHSMLSSICINGEGVRQDYLQAHMWSNLAVLRGTGEIRDRAVSTRDSAASRITREDLSEARRLARQWDAAYPQ